LNPLAGGRLKNLQSPYPNPYDKTTKIHFSTQHFQLNLSNRFSQLKLQARVKKTPYYQFH
jgi:hypothetical protein